MSEVYFLTKCGMFGTQVDWNSAENRIEVVS